MTAEKKELKECLTEIGLTEYEAASYAALMDSQPMTAVEIADKVGIHRPRIYDILKSMERKGLIYVQEGKPTKYMPLPPQQLVEVIAEAQEKDKKRRMDACDELVKTIEPIYRRAILPKDLSYMITGEKNVRDAAAKMLASAKRISFIAACDPERCVLTKSTMKKIEGRVRLITKKKMESDQQVEVKVFQIASNLGMLVADERETMLIVKKDGLCNCEKALYIKNSTMSAGFEQFFDFIWKSV